MITVIFLMISSYSVLIKIHIVLYFVFIILIFFSIKFIWKSITYWILLTWFWNIKIETNVTCFSVFAAPIWLF